MSRRIFLCLCAASVVFLSGSILLSSVTLDALEVGGVKAPGRWKASSPTVQSDTGEYLAYDVTGQSPHVYFTKEKGPHTTWAFVDMKKFLDHKGLVYKQGRTGPVAVEETGFTLRLRATEGPFSGWYLSRTKDGDLKLVKEAVPAAEVKFRLQRREVLSR